MRTEPSPNRPRDGGVVELHGVRRTQRDPGISSDSDRDRVKRRRRRTGTDRPERSERPERGDRYPRRDRGPGRRSTHSSGGGSSRPPLPPRESGGGLWAWFKKLFAGPARPPVPGLTADEQKACEAFAKHLGIHFNDPKLLRLALTHRSYLHVHRGAQRESNERLEFLGDSVLGVITSEHLYKAFPGEHEGQLTKTKSLLVSKAILSRRALAMGLGRFVLMSNSEVDSGGRQRLSILADAFESVLGAIYLDQGIEAARKFVETWLLNEAKGITSDKQHTNYKSLLQEYVQSAFHTHPVYSIRHEHGPDHSKLFT
ncbi:MAG: ribonuclease III, partial [Candidatus Eisenbacteria bacterium]